MTFHVDAAERPWTVCPTCDGEGHTGPGIAWTMSELNEWFSDDWFAMTEYMDDMRRGVFDVACVRCSGHRVVKADCECQDCEQVRYEMEEDRLVEMAERRIGC